MNPERWQRIEQLYHSTLEQALDQRDAFLKEACAGDESLREEVEALLACQSKVEALCESPAMEVAARAIAREHSIKHLAALSGRTLSHYRVLEKLGEGGMGVVYKAHDTRLNRSVALKVLPLDMISDPERKRRFVKEARAASALNHPNIVTIYDIDQAEGIDFIAMEYMAGKTLDELIPRSGIRIIQALKIAIQVAEGLNRTHSAGIIHRDLKPSNIMVTEDGLVKILDFGLAKLTELQSPLAQEASRPTSMFTETDKGTIAGTAAYMSPEQAEGKPVDARSDIFSFGSVLYEMVTGRRAFNGDSHASTMAAVLKDEPKPPSQLASDIPPGLERIIQRCLRKDKDRRWQHIKDLKIELQELKDESNSGALAAAGDLQPARRKRQYLLAGAVGLLSIAVLLAWLLTPASRPPEPALKAIPLTSFAGEEHFPAFSPDGNQVAFSWNGEKQDNFDIYVQLIGSGRPLQLTSDPAMDYSPAFSPDGRQIAFLRALPGGKCSVFLVPPLGGRERRVAEISGGPSWQSGMSWSPDGRWLAAPDRDAPGKSAALFLLSVETGEKRRLTDPPASAVADDISPAFSPDGRTLAFIRVMMPYAGSDVYLQALNEDRTPRGEAVRLTARNERVGRVAWTPDGQELIYNSGNAVQTQALWRIPASGQARPQRLDFAGEGAIRPDVSPAGERLVYERQTRSANIWVVETSGPATGQPKIFISSTRVEVNPQFSPDGKRIAFESTRSGNGEIWVCDADGSNAVQLTAFGGPDAGTPRWSPDGEFIVFDSLAAGNKDLCVVSASGGKPRALTTDPLQDRIPSWSHDGRWIYFSSNRRGSNQIWKMPALGGEAIQVTRAGGYVAFDSTDGKTLYYTKVPAGTGPLFKLPLEGGAESQVLESVTQRAFAVTEKGIYYIAPPDARGIALLRFLELASGKVNTIATLDKPLLMGLTVSPDGRTILYSQLDRTGSDLMLVENFR